MKERPILFNSEMVRAVLDGRKTQTRRVVKPQPPEYSDEYVRAKDGSNDFKFCASLDNHATMGVSEWMTCPYGVPGERLWVRETWRPWHEVDSECGCCIESCQCSGKLPSPVCYKATADVLSDEDREVGMKWHPSIHMFRKHSRILLEVVSVRVERAQEISEGDAIKEGIGRLVSHPRLHFINLWNSINAKRGFGWDENPWVWVVEFKRLAP